MINSDNCNCSKFVTVMGTEISRPEPKTGLNEAPSGFARDDRAKADSSLRSERQTQKQHHFGQRAHEGIVNRQELHRPVSGSQLSVVKRSVESAIILKDLAVMTLLSSRCVPQGTLRKARTRPLEAQSRHKGTSAPQNSLSSRLPRFHYAALRRRRRRRMPASQSVEAITATSLAAWP
jgi:hypothetical protein